MSAELGPDAEGPSGAIELHAVLWGVFSSGVFSVPIAIVVGLLDRSDAGSDSFGLDTILKLVLLLVSAIFAGFAAGRSTPSSRAANGALAGAITFLIVQITYAVAGGGPLRVLAVVYAGFLGACLGTLGGLLASRWAKGDEPRRSLDDEDDGDDGDPPPRRRSAFDPLFETDPDLDADTGTDTDNPGSTR